MFEKRIDRVIALMKENKLSQLLVTDPKSVWYLTGIDVEPYERLFALYIRADKTKKLFLNRLFCVPEIDAQKIWYDDTDDCAALLANEIDKESPLGIDKVFPARFLIPLMERCPKMTPRLASDLVDSCRACKDDEEKKLMREASRINDEVNVKASEFVKVGMTEKEVAEFIDNEYKKSGCEGNSFTTIVSFGKNAADPHHTPDNTVLKEGDCVLFDMGCRKDRYCSDMTRTFFCKKANPDEVKVHEIVLAANLKAESMIRPGVKLSELDKAARGIIEKEGYGKNFNHRLGHFIGQDDHEKGDVSLTSDIIAKEGMIFSIEPGIYIEGKFGVRIEDLVLVTKDGCEILNHVDKHYKIVG